jgi:hypothetical protein
VHPPAAAQPRAPAFIAGLPDPRGVRAAQPDGRLRYAPAAVRLRPSHRPSHHQPKPRKPTKTLIASGSRFGGRPRRDADKLQRSGRSGLAAPGWSWLALVCSGRLARRLPRYSIQPAAV